jgi:chromate transport protein ChrA
MIERVQSILFGFSIWRRQNPLRFAASVFSLFIIVPIAIVILASIFIEFKKTDHPVQFLLTALIPIVVILIISWALRRLSDSLSKSIEVPSPVAIPATRNTKTTLWKAFEWAIAIAVAKILTRVLFHQ